MPVNNQNKLFKCNFDFINQNYQLDEEIKNEKNSLKCVKNPKIKGKR